MNLNHRLTVRIRSNQIIDEVWNVEVDPSTTLEQAKQIITDDPYAIFGSGMWATMFESEVVDTVGITLLEIE